MYNSKDEFIPSSILKTLNIPTEILKSPSSSDIAERFIERNLIKNSDNTYSSNKNISLPSSLIENGEFKIKFKNINGTFDCSDLNLTSLEGAPEIVKGDFLCNNNKLTSLKGAPKQVDGNFNCSNNRKKFTEEEVKEISNVKGQIFV